MELVENDNPSFFHVHRVFNHFNFVFLCIVRWSYGREFRKVYGNLSSSQASTSYNSLACYSESGRDLLWVFSAFLSLETLWTPFNITVSNFAIVEGVCLVTTRFLSLNII